jgi:hypothetical protein
MKTGKAIQVIQWASGSMGRTAMRMVMDHPEMDLVGTLVYSARKRGMDVGEIANRPPSGVLATDNIDEIIQTDADIVIHMPRITLPYEALVPDVIRLLESGKNVISTAGFHWPDAHGESYAAPLRAAAIKGNVTLAGVGVNPGMVAERLVMAASAMSVDMDRVEIFETVDASAMASPEFVFGLMGLGSDPADKDIRQGPLSDLYGALFSEVLFFCANHLGSKISVIEPDHQLTIAPRDIAVAAGNIAKGTVAATEWRWTARLDNGTDLLLSIIWTADPSLHDSERQGHWIMNIKGRPDIKMTLDISESDPAKPPSRALTDAVCAVAINAIPEVIAAPAGLFAFQPPSISLQRKKV